jgi:signal transduction histidine kinase/ligand-binding sensor domain-containing protein
MRGPLFLAASIAIVGTVGGQEAAVAVGHFRVDVWRAEHGMPSNVVSRVARSDDGYLWIGTPAGLARFDGVRFTTFDHRNTPLFAGCVDGAIQPMGENRRGNALWIVTDRELVRYAGGRFVRDAVLDDSVVGESIAGLAEDSSGTVWAITDHGRLLRRQDGRLVTVPISGLPRAAGQSIVADDSGQLWLGFLGEGLVVVRPGPGTLRRILPGENVSAIARDRDGSVWAGTTTGVVHIASGRITRLRIAGAAPYAPVTSLGADADGSLWIGTEGNGIFWYAAGHLTAVTAQSGLISNDDITSVFVGPRAVWVGTRHGLNRYRAVNLSPLTTRNGSPTNAPGAIAIDRAGALWVAARTGGLYRRAHADSGAFVAIAPAMLSSDVVTSIAVGADSALWMGRVRAGLLRYRTGTWRTYPTGPVNAVLAARSGAIWIATGAGLERLWHEQVTRYSGLADTVILCLAEDRHGVIWAGTRVGLSRIDSTTTNYPMGAVATLYADASGAVWAGTPGGLTRTSGGRSVTLRRDQGLAPDVVTAIVGDGSGHLWLAGVGGVTRVPLAQLDAVADGRSARLDSVLTLTPVDGLPSTDMAIGAQWPTATTASGELWLAMERGLVSFDPTRIQPDAEPPRVYLERVEIDGTPAPLDTPLTIGPGARRLDFQYTGVSLRDGARVRFRYRLDGFDKAWVEAGATRTASYTNLAPGQYRFHVTARGADGPWTAAEAEVGMRIIPPFYRTPWFIIGSALAAAGLVAIVLRARRRVLEARFAAVLAERTRLAREIHDTLLQGFTGVALSLRAATRRLDGSDGSTRPLDEVLSLAQETLVDARKAVWDLRTPGESDGAFPSVLEHAARLTVSGAELPVVWSVSGRPRALGARAEGVLLKVCQEALANAVKHASAHRVWVALTYERRRARLTVRDDGCGFVVDPSGRSYAGHWGLLGMRERAEQINGRLRVASVEGTGTEVSLTVPYA